MHSGREEGRRHRQGVAITGLVFSVLAVLLGPAAAIGVTTFRNNEGAVNQLEQQVENLRDRLPTDVDISLP